MTREELRQRFEDETGNSIHFYPMMYVNRLESLICDPWTKSKDELPELLELVITQWGVAKFDGSNWYIPNEDGRLIITWPIQKWMKIPE